MGSAKSVCRICSGFCGFEFDIVANEIQSIRPDKDHPMSRGHACIKGAQGVAALKVENGRIEESLKREPEGGFSPISSTAVLDEIAGKLNTLVAEYGPRSVAVYFGTSAFNNTLGNIFSKAFLAALESPNLFTTMTLDQSAKWLTAARMGVHLGGTPQPEEVDVALVAGNNPPVSHYGFPATSVYCTDPGRRLRELKERGTKLIVVDPRLSETARRADIHLQIIPGEDATLYAGLTNLIFRNHWIDDEFCKLNATNVETLRDAVRDFSLDHVSQRTGVPADLIEEAARLLGSARKPRAGTGTGACMAPDSNLADFLIEAINVLRAGYRRAGEMVPRTNLLGGQAPVDGVVGPNRTWERDPRCRTADVGRIFGEFPCALLPDEIMEPGDDKIRALIVFAGNPAMSMVDPEKTVTALKDLDLLVTMDHRVTETGLLSDYVVATSTQYERHDLSALPELMWDKGLVQYYPPIVQPPAEVIHDWAFFWELARRMELSLDFKFVTWGGPNYEDVSESLRLDMETQPDPEDLFEWICALRGVSFADVKVGDYGFLAPSEQIEVAQASSDARLDLCPDDIANDLHDLRHRRMNPDYTYRLAGRRLLASFNSHYRRGDHISSDKALNFALMNPDDMKEQSIDEGSRIEITSEYGSIIGIAKGDGTVRTGVVSMAHSWGSLSPESDPEGKQGAHTARLIPLSEDAREKINFMPHQTGVPIRVSSISEARV